MRKLFFCIVAFVLFVSVNTYAADPVYQWNLVLVSKAKISHVGKDYSITDGTCTLYDDNTFDLYEDDYGTDRHYTGSYQIINGKTIIFSLDQQGLNEIETMLTDWVEGVAEEEGVQISNISFVIKQLKISKAKINKKTNMPKKMTVTIKGTVSAFVDGSYETSNFQHKGKLTFFSNALF
jgi:hypothetical protein